MKMKILITTDWYLPVINGVDFDEVRFGTDWDSVAPGVSDRRWRTSATTGGSSGSRLAVTRTLSTADWAWAAAGAAAARRAQARQSMLVMGIPI